MRWLLRLLLAGLILALCTVAGAAAYAWHTLSAPENPGEPVLYLVQRGQSLYGISQELESQNLIRDARMMRLYARLIGKQDQVKTGYYRLSGTQGTLPVLNKLVNGETEKIPYTIPEGYRIDQANQNLGQHQLSPERYLELARNPKEEWIQAYPLLQGTSAEKSLEGYLFPDTYHLTGSEEELIEAQLARFHEVVQPLWESRSASHPLNFDDTIKLASIVELEGLLDRELPIIAGVFLQRLKIGMKLESDPTTEYALGWHQGDKGLSFEDIKIDSPYNTYRYPGLPPTPIGNPGKAAIHAVLNPQRTPYLFFVAKGDGSHAFSKTYAEHLAAIRRILAAKRGQ